MKCVTYARGDVGQQPENSGNLKPAVTGHLWAIATKLSLGAPTPPLRILSFDRIMNSN